MPPRMSLVEPPPRLEPEPETIEPERMPPESGPLEFKCIEDYDRQVGAPVDWAASRQREQVRGELIANQARQVDLDRARMALEKERGKLLPITTVEERESAADEIMRRHLQTAATLAAEIARPDQIAAVQARILSWIEATQTAISDELADV